MKKLTLTLALLLALAAAPASACYVCQSDGSCSWAWFGYMVCTHIGANNSCYVNGESCVFWDEEAPAPELSPDAAAIISSPDVPTLYRRCKANPDCTLYADPKVIAALEHPWGQLAVSYR